MQSNYSNMCHIQGDNYGCLMYLLNRINRFFLQTHCKTKIGKMCSGFFFFFWNQLKDVLLHFGPAVVGTTRSV